MVVRERGTTRLSMSASFVREPSCLVFVEGGGGLDRFRVGGAFRARRVENVRDALQRQKESWNDFWSWRMSGWDMRDRQVGAIGIHGRGRRCKGLC